MRTHDVGRVQVVLLRLDDLHELQFGVRQLGLHEVLVLGQDVAEVERLQYMILDRNSARQLLLLLLANLRLPLRRLLHDRVVRSLRVQLFELWRAASDTYCARVAIHRCRSQLSLLTVNVHDFQADFDRLLR